MDLSEYLLKAGLRKLQIEHSSFLPEAHAHNYAPAAIGHRHGTSRIEELRFIDCSPRTLGVLPGILCSIRRLKRFLLETNFPSQARQANPDTITIPSQRISPSGLAEAMHVHCKNLEELLIAFSDGASFLSDSVMHDLKDYISLKRLAMPEPFLLLTFDCPSFHHLLPQQLEELQIQYPMDTHAKRDLSAQQVRIRRMEALAQYRSKNVPSLKQVIWWYQQCQSAVDEDDNDGLVYDPEFDLRRLCGDFKSPGVRFERISSPYFGCTPLAKPLEFDRRSHEA